MPSIDQIIAGNNRRKLYGGSPLHELTCSCRNEVCILDEKCNAKDIIYEASLSDPDTTENHSYIGMTAEEFRKRHSKHKLSFQNPNYKNATTLSKKFWELKEKGQCPQAKFKILRLSKSYSAGDKCCLLCTDEKIEIINSNKEFQLNNRREIFSACRHKARIKYNRLMREKVNS